MTRKYSNPRSFRSALEDRLRGPAQDGKALVRGRQLLIFERFLARVFAVLGDAVTLKGGLVLEFRLQRARTTKDVDLRWMGPAESILDKLREAGRLELGDYMGFLVERNKKRPEIDGEGVIYGGQRFVVTCYLGGEQYGNTFGVDVALGEPIVGAPEVIVAADRLDFIGVAAPKLRVYPLETHIAEKLHAYTLPRSGPNGRVKDLPDLALLAQVRPIRRAELRGALQQTFHFRAVHPLPSSFPDPPSMWEQPYAALARDNHLPWTTLVEVTAAARAFVEPALGDDAAAEWDPAAWAWRVANR